MNIKKYIFLKTTIIFLLLFLLLLRCYIPSGFKSIISYLFLLFIFITICSGKIVYNKIPKKYFSINKNFFLIVFCIFNLFLFISYINTANSFKFKDENDYFQKNKQFIYQYIVNNINSSNYQDAIDEINKYNKFNDINLQNYKSIAQKRKSDAEKKLLLQQKQLQEQQAAKQAIIDKANKEQALKESIEIEKRMNEKNIEDEKKAHLLYLKNNEEQWLNTIKDDEKLNVSFVIKDMAQAYSGLIELYPNNKYYQKRGKYWIDSNNEEIEHQNDIDSIYNSRIVAMRKKLKDNVNNPDSLKIVSERYYDHIDDITIEIVYRATNSYNAIIKDRMLARFNLKTGKLIRLSLSSYDE